MEGEQQGNYIPPNERRRACAGGEMMTYSIQVINRDTGEIVQTETRRSLDAATKVWDKAVENVNPLKYKLVWTEAK